MEWSKKQISLPVFLPRYWAELSKMQGKTYLEMPGAVPGCAGVGLETKENHFHQTTGNAPKEIHLHPKCLKEEKKALAGRPKPSKSLCIT